MKAIHNGDGNFTYDLRVVYDPAKLVKMKAIHNDAANFCKSMQVVYDPAKLVKMKAIHNNFKFNLPTI